MQDLPTYRIDSEGSLQGDIGELVTLLGQSIFRV